MGVLLRTEGLTKTFPGTDNGVEVAVDHVSFQMEEGETLGLVGESGCGKSTLARLVTRLTEPTSGTISFCGEDITRARGKALRRIYRRMQMVFQSPAGSFDPRKTIGYSIGESLCNEGVHKSERKDRTAQLLEQCGLSPEYAKRYPHEISGGECQRAAIARALAIRPTLLLCDEATSSLDVTVQHQIMELLNTLRREQQLSLLFICHNLALVQSFCDRVLVMQAGKIVEAGPTEQILRSPQTEYTKRLMEAAL